MYAKKVDTKEFELPETHFVRDIENRVFQEIVLQCLSRIDGINLAEGNFIDNIFGRTAPESVKGIYIEQDNRHQTVSIRIEVNIVYGHSIPEKAEEIQTICSDEITKLTGLHVSFVHVIFKSIAMPGNIKRGALIGEEIKQALLNSNSDSEYNDEF